MNNPPHVIVFFFAGYMSLKFLPRLRTIPFWWGTNNNQIPRPFKHACIKNLSIDRLVAKYSIKVTSYSKHIGKTIMVSATFDELTFLPDWLPRWHVTGLRVQPRRLRFGGRQSTVRRVAKKRVFPVSRALGGTCQSWSRFAVLLQDLTPLHVNITRSTNLLSESCWVFVGGNSNYRRIYIL